MKNRKIAKKIKKVLKIAERIANDEKIYVTVDKNLVFNEAMEVYKQLLRDKYSKKTK